MSLKTWYWKSSTGIPSSNFGDLLGPLLLKRFADVDVDRAETSGEAHILAVGSIMESVQPEWGGIALGIGSLHRHTDAQKRLRGARVLALRGPHTARGMRGDFVLADPGLLADELVQPYRKHNLGIVPHWSDKRTWDQFRQWDPFIIDVRNDPLQVLEEIGSCKKIISSSLHGVIVADAFGIPRRIEYSETMDREGGQFKFEDYHASIKMPLELGVTKLANRHRIEDLQNELYDAFEYAGQLLRGEL